MLLPLPKPMLLQRPDRPACLPVSKAVDRSGSRMLGHCPRRA
jgi:hypothetical protein